jgi:hypothetical protein
MVCLLTRRLTGDAATESLGIPTLYGHRRTCSDRVCTRYLPRCAEHTASRTCRALTSAQEEGGGRAGRRSVPQAGVYARVPTQGLQSQAARELRRRAGAAAAARSTVAAAATARPTQARHG